MFAQINATPVPDDFNPSNLQTKVEEELPRIIAANESDPSHDPIMKDLLKMTGRTLPVMEKRDGNSKIYNLSLQLMELLELILEPMVSDDLRMHYEQELKDLISTQPKVKTGPKSYPNDFLSRLLIDNYSLLIKTSTSYFNMSLSSLITRYLVNIIYNLECWEIYHLLYVIPNFDYILNILDFDIKLTTFGYVVKPPPNFLNFNLRQGLQYPFPYPFYNFSFHSIDPESKIDRLKRIKVEPYIDIRLDKNNFLRKKVKATGEKLSPQSSSLSMSPTRSQDYANSKSKKRFSFIQLTPQMILNDACDLEDEDDGYNSESAQTVRQEEERHAIRLSKEFSIVPCIFDNTFKKPEKKGNSKSGNLHQCRLIDPHTQKLCLKDFYGKNELQRHQEFVHATKKRIFRCQYCSQEGITDQTYPRHDSLARHIRRKHGITGRENKMAVMLARQNSEYEEESSNMFDSASRAGASSAIILNPRAKIHGTQQGSNRKPLSLPKEQSNQDQLNGLRNSSSHAQNDYSRLFVNSNPTANLREIPSQTNTTNHISNSTFNPQDDYRGPHYQGFSYWPSQGAPYFETTSRKHSSPGESIHGLSTHQPNFYSHGSYSPNFPPQIYQQSETMYYGGQQPMNMPPSKTSGQFSFVNTVLSPQYSTSKNTNRHAQANHSNHKGMGKEP